MDPLTELLLDAPSNIPPVRWPHKCDECGRFVSHEQLRSSSDSQGEYWSTAYCSPCEKRTNANPI